MQCGCMNCCFVVKAPANAIMQRKQRELGQKQLWRVLQNWLLRSHPWHGRIWVNSECTHECRIIMLSRTEISFVISFFDFEKFGVKSRFPFFKTHTVYNTGLQTPLLGHCSIMVLNRMELIYASILLYYSASKYHH